MTSPIPTMITCVDCGGRCHLISFLDPDGMHPGDVVAFRCEDCLDLWDVELTEDDFDTDQNFDTDQ